MLKEEIKTAHERIDQLEISSEDEEEMRRIRREERSRKDRVMDIKIKVSHFQKRNDQEA